MISKQLIIAGLCFILAIIGIERSIYWILFFIACLFGFIIHLITHKHIWINSNSLYDTIRTKFIRTTLVTSIPDVQEDSSSNPKSFKSKKQRTPLTGVSDIDEAIYELVDLFVRDYIEIWYKTQLSSDESFINDVKHGIYTTIRHLSERLREIDWLDFCTGTLVDSFATHVRLYRKAKERLRLENSADIRSCFFDLEAEYERGICRDMVCMDKDKEKEFLRDIAEVLIYILLPANEFRCTPARVLLREVIVNLGLIRFIDKYSDPDAINQLIINMCQQIPLTIDNFLLVVRTTDSGNELKNLIDRLDIEISRWRSKDTGGENDSDIRATLNSYQYLKKLLKDRYDTHNRTETTVFDDEDVLPKVPYRDIPLTDVLNNCNGLDYFLKFLQSMDSIGYGNFYLNAEAFRCAALTAFQPNPNTTSQQQETNQLIVRNMANDLVEQYFLPTGTYKLQMDETLLNKTLKVLKTETVDETLLDEIQTKVFEILSSDKYYGQFKKTPQYMQALSELEFNDPLIDNSDAASLSSNNSNEICNDSVESQQQQPANPSPSLDTTITNASEIVDNIDNFLISTEINESGVCCEKGERYAIYVISVFCKPIQGSICEPKREWVTYRRYSEFNDLHMTIRKRFPALKEFIHLPTKNFIDNTSVQVRLKRQKELNDYLNTLTNPKVFSNNPGLNELLLKFLRNQHYKHEQTELARKMDTITNPFKQASIGIGKGVSKIGAGLTIVSDSVVENIFRPNPNNNNRMNINIIKGTEAFSIAEETQAENAKNIPLRVLLVIMDEVFDLKQKNMWFRSRFVSILKRFLRAFMGDSVNRRIATFIQHWTSPKKIAKEIKRFKENFWPSGNLADKAPERDEGVRSITQVICKAKLLGIVSDEMRHIIGSETTRRGLLRLFELLQNETLNRRFVYIVIEALLIKLFRPNDLHLVFEKLYSQSDRVKEEYRRRIIHQEYHQNSGHVNNQHHVESNPRPYYLQRLSVRNDDHIVNQRTNSVQQPTILSRSLSKISR